MRRKDFLFTILATCLGLLAICSFVEGTQQNPTQTRTYQIEMLEDAESSHARH